MFSVLAFISTGLGTLLLALTSYQEGYHLLFRTPLRQEILDRVMKRNLAVLGSKDTDKNLEMPHIKSEIRTLQTQFIGYLLLYFGLTLQAVQLLVT